MKTSRNDNIRMLAVSLVGALGLLAASCSKDPQADVPGGGSAGTGKTITATFDLTRDFGQSITVKADGSEDVTSIKDLWVIQMAQDGSALLQAPHYFERLTPVEDDYRVECDMQAAPSKMVFVANTHDANAYAGLELTSTEADMAAVARDITDEADLTAGGIPMSGTWSGTPDSAIPGKVRMSRAVARVTFNLGADLPEGDSFEVMTVQVKQVPSTMNYYRDETNPDVYPSPGLTAGGIIDYSVQVLDNLKFVGGGIFLII